MSLENLNEEGARRIANDLGVPDEVQFNVFYQYCKLIKVVAERSKSKKLNILEIGSGYSTVLWGMLAEEMDITVNTIDLSFETILRATNATKYTQYLKNINFLEGLSVAAVETQKFYSKFPNMDFGGMDWGSIVRSSSYITELHDVRRSNHLKEKYGVSDLTGLREIMATDPDIISYLLDYYSNFGSFEKELEILSKYNVILSPELIASKFDVIFFDSGELSSNIEFFKLKDSLSENAIVGLHDIYFPKSFKSFVPCTMLDNNPEFNRLLLDKSTSQGMYVTEKI
ncbi:MAG: hypothetical protein K9I02_03950 [Haliscomenobacter sp.]|nr:hypothetical protein [Haliscomenobacter sp.]